MNTNNYVKVINASVKLSAVFLEIEEHLQKIDQSITLSIEMSSSTCDCMNYSIYLDAGNIEKYDLIFTKFAQLEFDPTHEKYYLSFPANDKRLYELNFMSIIPDMIREAIDYLNDHTRL